MTLRIIFAGTPEFARVMLAQLVQSPHTVCAVYTQPDRPAGRGQQLTASAVKQLALAHYLPIYQPNTLRDPSVQSTLSALKADVMVVAAYGLLLPAPILNATRLGCINVHASLLPRWRGAAPIQRAILAGDKLTGITLMQMSEGLDTGDSLLKLTCAIGPEETAGELYARLADLGAKGLLTILEQLQNNSIQRQPQDEKYACYASKIVKTEAHLNWQLPASQLHQLIKAFNPWPVAYTSINGQLLKVWRAQCVNDHFSKPPGMIVDHSPQGIVVAAGDQGLCLTQLQLAGSKVLNARELLKGHSDLFAIGNQLG